MVTDLHPVLLMKWKGEVEKSKKLQVKVVWKKQGKGYKKACWVS